MLMVFGLAGCALIAVGLFAFAKPERYLAIKEHIGGPFGLDPRTEVAYEDARIRGIATAVIGGIFVVSSVAIGIYDIVNRMH